MSLSRRTTTHAAYRPQHGRSLMELMVALVIGFIILGSVMLMTTGSNFSGMRSSTQSRMDEDAQMVLAILGPQVRMAGYSAVFHDRNDGVAYKRFMGPAVRGCDNGFANAQAAAWRGDTVQRHSDVLTCAAGGDGPAISVLYEADTLNTVPNAAGDPTDCLGQSVRQVPSSLQSQAPTAAAAFVTAVENRYFLRKNGTVSDLLCAGNGDNASDPFAGPQILIPHIESLSVLSRVRNTGVSGQRGTGFNH